MKKPRHLIDRDLEWEELSRLWDSPRPELVTVLGRRRVGKSYLLGQFLERHHGVYYQATRLTEAEQLRALSIAIGDALGDSALSAGSTFESWTNLLDYLARRLYKERALIILDEFPYLVEASPALPSLLQSFWDRQLASTKIKVVLSGSYVSAMKRLSDVDQPLFGRRTSTLPIAPFSYADAAQFFPRYSARDKAMAYGIFGGVAGHLALLDSNRSLADNVQSNIISPMGRLHDEASHVLDAFLGDAAVHYSVLDAIASGNQTWAKITTIIGKNSASLSRPLDWLEGMDIIDREEPITATAGGNPKLARYVLHDHYLRFWHRIMAPIIRSGATSMRSPSAIWSTQVAGAVDDHMGSVFEDMCRQFVWRTQTLPFTPIRVGRWWDNKGTNDIDVVAYDERGNVLFGECKWGAGRAQDVAWLKERAEPVLRELKKVHRVYYALFTGRTRRDISLDRALTAHDCMRIPIEDMYDS